MADKSLFDEMGGEPALRRLIERFIDRVYGDVMIGYLFRNADRARIKEKEYEHALSSTGTSTCSVLVLLLGPPCSSSSSRTSGNLIPTSHSK